MAYWIFLTLYFLHAIAPSLSEWAQSDLVSRQGETVTVDCTVDFEGDMFGVLRVARILEDGPVKESVILDSETIKDKYAATGRYSVEYLYDAPAGTGTVHLTFDGIRGEDAGQLVCYNINDEDKKAYITMQVYVPVSRIYMVKISDADEVEAASGATVHLREGAPSGVGCVVQVDGSQVAPAVVVRVNGQDETNRFTKLENPRSIVAVDGSPDKDFTEVKYTYVNVAPDAIFNQKNLTCTATAEGFDPVTAHVYLDVKYKPVLTCSKYEHYAAEGASATIACSLRANPGATVTWAYGEDEQTATEVVPGNDPNIVVSEKPFDEDKTDLTLTITSVAASRFTNYYLTATNSLGTSSTKVSLHKGAEVTPAPTPVPQPDPPSKGQVADPKADQVQGNTSSRCLASVVVLVLSIVLQML